MNTKKIENIVWHIETNRRVAGDKQVLDDVLKSLKNFLKETAQEVPVQEQSKFIPEDSNGKHYAFGGKMKCR